MDRIPILKLQDLLLVTVQIDMDDRLALTLQEDLAAKVSESGARGVLIDISAVSIVDSFMGRILSNIASTTRILGAETVVVGVQPAVAITLVELGMLLPRVETALNIEKGMALLRARVGPGDGEADGRGVEAGDPDGDELWGYREGEAAGPRTR